MKFESYSECTAKTVKCPVIKQLYSHFLQSASKSHVLIHNLYRSECVQTNAFHTLPYCKPVHQIPESLCNVAVTKQACSFERAHEVAI
jgi:hypothetical protein